MKLLIEPKAPAHQLPGRQRRRARGVEGVD